MPVKTFEIKKGEDTRDKSRFHVKMIFGTRHARIIDTRLSRAMKLPLDETVTEANFRDIFEEVVEGLIASGNMASDESAACITFPDGMKVIDVPMSEGVN